MLNVAVGTAVAGVTRGAEAVADRLADSPVTVVDPLEDTPVAEA
jgi:hypothetical protein